MNNFFTILVLDSLCSENLHNKVQMALSEKAENNKEKFLIRLVDDLNKELDKYYCEKQDFKLQVTYF